VRHTGSTWELMAMSMGGVGGVHVDTSLSDYSVVMKSCVWEVLLHGMVHASMLLQCGQSSRCLPRHQVSI
jgi:hypothetical protein